MGSVRQFHRLVTFLSIGLCLQAPISGQVTPAFADPSHCPTALKAALDGLVYGPTEEESKLLAKYSGNLFKIKPRSPAANAELNEKMLTELEGLPLPQARSESRPGTFTREAVDELYNDVKSNKQVRESLCGSYGGSPSSYGFCWGRAMAAHLKALQHGGVNEGIRKIWMVGNLKTGDTSWRYHVTTIVRVGDGQWYAVDPIFDHPMPIHEWYQEMRREFDPGGTARLYSSPAHRFDPDRQSKYKLSVLSNDPDFYYGFFSDLLNQIHRENTGRPGPWSKIKSGRDRSKAIERACNAAGIVLTAAAVAAGLAYISSLVTPGKTRHSSGDHPTPGHTPGKTPGQPASP